MATSVERPRRVLREAFWAAGTLVRRFSLATKRPGRGQDKCRRLNAELKVVCRD